MERTPKEWQSLVLRFKSRIAAIKELMESEYGAVENEKTKTREVGKTNNPSSSKP
tara:strand:- start:921 stop:1085 length:165 start_codon:yes stop_codon:yes gene_type:complete